MENILTLLDPKSQHLFAAKKKPRVGPWAWSVEFKVGLIDDCSQDTDAVIELPRYPTVIKVDLLVDDLSHLPDLDICSIHSVKVRPHGY